MADKRKLQGEGESFPSLQILGVVKLSWCIQDLVNPGENNTLFIHSASKRCELQAELEQSVLNKDCN